MISTQTSKPNLTIVQDALLGVYKLTRFEKELPRHIFYDITMEAEINGPDGSRPVYTDSKINTIQSVFNKFGADANLFSGKALFSLILPEDLFFEFTNKTDPNEPTVKIFNGVLYAGAIDKKVLGAHGSLLQVISKNYGLKKAGEFIDNVHFIMNKYLSYVGFSIGLADCMLEESHRNAEIQNTISKCYTEVKSVEETTVNGLIKEIRTVAALNRSKDVGMKIAKESMTPTNGFLSTVVSGSKGDYFNISQITGLLGQQHITGKRIAYGMNHRTRALPHYPLQLEDLSEVEKYESKGFVKSSFIHGLNPKEFYFHAMSGREGITDTAQGTARSGYLQRKIIKTCEDMNISYDSSVRDSTNRMYQPLYGDLGFDTRKLFGGTSFCNVNNIVNTLNTQHETELGTVYEEEFLEV